MKQVGRADTMLFIRMYKKKTTILLSSTRMLGPYFKLCSAGGFIGSRIARLVIDGRKIVGIRQVQKAFERNVWDGWRAPEDSVNGFGSCCWCSDAELEAVVMTITRTNINDEDGNEPMTSLRPHRSRMFRKSVTCNNFINGFIHKNACFTHLSSIRYS